AHPARDERARLLVVFADDVVDDGVDEARIDGRALARLGRIVRADQARIERWDGRGLIGRHVDARTARRFLRRRRGVLRLRGFGGGRRRLFLRESRRGEGEGENESELVQHRGLLLSERPIEREDWRARRDDWRWGVRGRGFRYGSDYLRRAARRRLR